MIKILNAMKKKKKELLSSSIPSDLGSNSRFYESSKTKLKKQKKSFEYPFIKFKMNEIDETVSETTNNFIKHW